MTLQTLWAQVWASDSPVLPPLVQQQWLLVVAWGLVLSALVWWGAARLRQARNPGKPVEPSRVGALGLLAGVLLVLCLPGPWSPAYWLGLAFQWPSLSLVALSAWSLFRRSQGDADYSGGDLACGVRKAETARHALWWLGAALWVVVVGWVLLLDTYAAFAGEWYALGFGSGAVVLVGVPCLLPLVFGASAPAALRFGAPAVLLLAILSRLPTGNLWDAMLDPWLWVLAHGVLAHGVLAHGVVARWVSRTTRGPKAG